MSTNPKEKCFCPAPDNCLTKNLMDLTKCVGVPLIASLPHLLGSDEKYLEMVDGLHPNEARICNSYSRCPRRATAWTYFRFKNSYLRLILTNSGYRYRCARIDRFSSKRSNVWKNTNVTKKCLEQKLYYVEFVLYDLPYDLLYSTIFKRVFFRYLSNEQVALKKRYELASFASSIIEAETIKFGIHQS